MKVAIATQDLTRVDAHLGWARHVMIYEVDDQGYCYLDQASFPAATQDGDHSKLAPRLQAVRDCQLIFVADVGPDGEFELARAKVVPIRQFAGQPIALALDALRDGLRAGRSAPWLRQAEQSYRRANL
jgi:nitrogen fixation protein NifX